MNTLVARAVYAVSSLWFPYAAVAGPINLIRAINDPNPVTDGEFSYAMARYDNYVLVGATGSKTVYLIDHKSGETLGTYRSPDGSGNVSSFGGALTQIDSGRFAVGDAGLRIGGQRNGSVYVFDAATGQSLHSIRNPNPGTSLYFGSSIESTAGRLFASANSLSSDPGMVHAFDPDTGLLQQTLHNPDETDHSYGFGFDLIRHHDDLFVSAPGAFAGSVQSGIVYRYAGKTLQKVLEIAPPDPANTAGFGWSLDANDSLLLVGAPHTRSGGLYNVGEAHLFDAATGALLRTFKNPSPTPDSDMFGNAVALVGGFAVISTKNSPNAVLVYDTMTGNYIGSIANPGNISFFAQNTGSQNGGLISVGNQLLVSGWANDAGEFNSGTMFLYSVPEPSTAMHAIIAFAIVTTLYARGRMRVS